MLLELLHLEFFPIKNHEFCGNYYALVVVDDYFYHTWILSLSHQKDKFVVFQKLALVMQN